MFFCSEMSCQILIVKIYKHLYINTLHHAHHDYCGIDGEKNEEEFLIFFIKQQNKVHFNITK